MDKYGRGAGAAAHTQRMGIRFIHIDEPTGADLLDANFIKMLYGGDRFEFPKRKLPA